MSFYISPLDWFKVKGHFILYLDVNQFPQKGNIQIIGILVTQLSAN